jgi:hypothetical protein
MRRALLEHLLQTMTRRHKERPMNATERAARIASWTLAAGAGAYAGHTALTWLRYGHVDRPGPRNGDALLDTFMPRYEVVERMSMKVQAPAAITLTAAERQELMTVPTVSAIFRLRQWVMGAGLEQPELPRPLIEQVKALGWVELARIPGREVVMGAVTQPWQAAVTFRGVAPDDFAGFQEPGYVKIAWTLRADPLGPDSCRFLTETRAVATDEMARARFRTYWALVAPGVSLIRRLSFGPMRREAERLALAA